MAWVGGRGAELGWLSRLNKDLLCQPTPPEATKVKEGFEQEVAEIKEEYISISKLRFLCFLLFKPAEPRWRRWEVGGLRSEVGSQDL
jgi:hypothetical protein